MNKVYSWYLDKWCPSGSPAKKLANAIPRAAEGLKVCSFARPIPPRSTLRRSHVVIVVLEAAQAGLIRYRFHGWGF